MSVKEPEKLQLRENLAIMPYNINTILRFHKHVHINTLHSVKNIRVNVHHSSSLERVRERSHFDSDHSEVTSGTVSEE